MATKTVNLETAQLSYIEEYAQENGISDSEAARELISKGIEWEERGGDVL